MSGPEPGQKTVVPPKVIPDAGKTDPAGFILLPFSLYPFNGVADPFSTRNDSLRAKPQYPHLTVLRFLLLYRQRAAGPLPRQVTSPDPSTAPFVTGIGALQTFQPIQSSMFHVQGPNRSELGNCTF